MRIICFGDEIGLKILARAIPNACICGIVSAEGRDRAVNVAKVLAKNLNIPFLLQPKSRHYSRYNDFISKIEGLKPDLGIVCSYSLVLPETIFNIPPKGMLNIHGGLLPEYRGANILNWVLINGEQVTGVTIHRITKRVDAGPIVAQKKVTIEFTDTALTLRKKLESATVDLLKESWHMFLKDPIPAKPQDESKAKRYPRRFPDDGLIDWRNMSAMEIYNLIRALVSPWPGAYYFDNKGQKVIIDKFIPFEEVKRLQQKLNGYGIQ